MKHQRINRRNSPRLAAGNLARIECRQVSLGLGPNLAIEALDLSRMGVRLMISEPLEADLQVEILLFATGMAKPVRRLGRVAWCLAAAHGHNIVGVAFDKPPSPLWCEAIASVPAAAL
jgi:hypothetical protein